MLNETQEEILESIWSVGDRQHNTIEAVRKRCSVDFTEADLVEMERQELIVRDQDEIRLANKGKAIAEIIIRSNLHPTLILPRPFHLNTGQSAFKISQ